MLDNAFTIFCEGVAANNCLQALDLRNNQISHDSAAELCRALKQNHTIKALGLYFDYLLTVYVSGCRINPRNNQSTDDSAADF